MTHPFGNGRNANIGFRGDDQIMKTDQMSLVHALSFFRNWSVCALPLCFPLPHRYLLSA